MWFRLLGPVEAWDRDHRVDLGKAGSAKVRCMLAALLRDPGEFVSTDVLTERVWGEDPPGAPVRYKYVGWLRAALEPFGVRLTHRDNGYVLAADPDQVDLHRFRALTARARRAAAAGRPEETAELLREALGLWRGPALAGLPGAWAELFRDQLAQERFDATVARIRADLELGRHAEVVSELAGWHTERPADETITGLLMLALYRNGQRAQALACYRRAEEHIRTALGTEPGRDLADLRQRIQDGDEALLPDRLVIGAGEHDTGSAGGPQPGAVSVVIAEDSAVVRESLAWLLTMRGHEVAAAVASPDALRASVAEQMPDVAVVDVRLPPTYTDDGLRAAISLRRDFPGLGVLVLSEYIETRYTAELLADRAEGVGYLRRDRVADVTEFTDALLRVAGGGTALDPEAVSQLLGPTRNGVALGMLTAGELRVISLMAEGRPNRAIARALQLPAGDVDKHVSRIFAKLGLPETGDGQERICAVLRYLHG